MSIGKLAPSRFRPFIPACLVFGGAAGLLTAAGCGRHSTPAPTASVAVNPPANPPAAPAFQPYTVLTQPPPTPAVVTHVHRNLHLIHTNNRVALADTSGRVYDVGRDTSGHIYPVYRSPSDGRTYPLYYDSARDRYYRVVRDDGGRYLRGYADDPADQYYVADRDYERYTPSDSDRPIITNYNTNDYYDGGAPYGSNGYHTASSQHHSHNNNWLWAIPVVAAAYFLLRPHHSSPPKPSYYPQRTAYVHTVPGHGVTQVNSNNHIVNQVNNYNYGGAGYPHPHGGVYPRPLAPPNGAFHDGHGDHSHGYPAGAPPHQPWPTHLALTSHKAAPAPPPMKAPRLAGKPAPPKQRRVHPAVAFVPAHSLPTILHKTGVRPLFRPRPVKPMPNMAARPVSPPRVHSTARPVIAKPFVRPIVKSAPAPQMEKVSAPAHLVKTIRREEPPKPEPRVIVHPAAPARQEIMKHEVAQHETVRPEIVKHETKPEPKPEEKKPEETHPKTTPDRTDAKKLH